MRKRAGWVRQPASSLEVQLSPCCFRHPGSALPSVLSAQENGALCAFSNMGPVTMAVFLVFLVLFLRCDVTCKRRTLL